MRSVKTKYIWGVALVLGLALLGTLAQARSLDSREEAALFSLADLGPVDLDRLGALSGAILSRAQAERILVELANVVVTD